MGKAYAIRTNISCAGQILLWTRPIISWTHPYVLLSDISYSIAIEKDGFKVEPDTGKIYTTKSLDHEETPRIKLFLKATVGKASLYGLCLVGF